MTRSGKGQKRRARSASGQNKNLSLSLTSMNLRTQIQCLYFLGIDREYFCTFVYAAQGAAEMKLRIQIFPIIFLAFPGEERVRWARGLQMAEYLETVLSSRMDL